MIVLVDGSNKVLQGRKVVLGGSLLLDEDASGLPRISVTGVGTGNVSGTGTAGRIAKFTSGTDIASSLIADDGTTLTMLGQIVLTTGSGGGLRFPNDPFGGTGDTAGLRYISRAGEDASLELYVTADTNDYISMVVPANDNVKINGYTVYHAGNLPASSGVTGNGTAGRMAVWNGLSSLTDSLVRDNGTGLAIGQAVDTTTAGGYLSLAAGTVHTKINLNISANWKLRLAGDGNAAGLLSNAYWDGSAWQRDDTTATSMAFLLHSGSNRFEFRIASAATGTVGWTTPLNISAAGVIGVASGGIQFDVGGGNSIQLKNRGSNALYVRNATSANTFTALELMPNGTPATDPMAQISLWRSDYITDQTNYGRLLFRSYAGSYRIQGDIAGSLTHAPLDFYIGASRNVRFNTDQTTTFDSSVTVSAGTAQLPGTAFVKASDNASYALLRHNAALGILIQGTGMTASRAGGGLHLAGGSFSNSPDIGGIWAGATSDLGTYTAWATDVVGIELRAGVVTIKTGNGATVGANFSPTTLVTIGASGFTTSLGMTTNAGLFVLNGNAATTRSVAVNTAGSTRWKFGGDSTAEGGSNAGSDFFVNAYTDAGAFLSTPFQITRATGAVSMSGGLLSLTNGTSNVVLFGSGLGAPTFTTRSTGTKIVLASAVGASTVDYAIGMQSSNVWFSTTNSSGGFKWYAGTTEVMALTGAGNLTIQGTGTFGASLFGGSVSVGTGNTAKINIDGTDAVLVANETAIGEIGGELNFTGRAGYMFMMDNNNAATDKLFKIRTNNTATDLLKLDESGNLTITGKFVSGSLGSVVSGQSNGDMLYYTGSAFSRLAIGPSGYVISSTGSAPQWTAAISNIGSGNVNNVAVAGTVATYATTTFSPAAGTPATPGAAPVITALYRAITVDMSAYSLAAGQRYVLEYATSADAFATWTELVRCSGNKVVHSNLDLTRTYKYRYSVQATGTSGVSPITSALAPASSIDVVALGIVTAAQLAVANLSAVSAKLGVVTSGLVQNSDTPTAVLRLDAGSTAPSSVGTVLNWIDLAATGTANILRFGTSATDAVLTLSANGVLTINGDITTTNLTLPSGVAQITGALNTYGTFDATGIVTFKDSTTSTKALQFSGGNLAVYRSVGGNDSKQRVLIGDYTVVVGSTSQSTSPSTSWGYAGSPTSLYSGTVASHTSATSGTAQHQAVDNNSTIEFPSTNSQYSFSFQLTVNSNRGSSGASSCAATCDVRVSYQRFNSGTAVDSTPQLIGTVASRTASTGNVNMTGQSIGTHTVTVSVPSTSTWNEIRFFVQTTTTVSGGLDTNGGGLTGTGTSTLDQLSAITWTGFSGSAVPRRGVAIPADDAQPSLYIEPITNPPTQQAAGEVWINNTKKRIEWNDGTGTGHITRWVNYELTSDFVAPSTSAYTAISGFTECPVKAGETYIFEFEGMTGLNTGTAGLGITLMFNNGAGATDISTATAAGATSFYRYIQTGNGGSGTYLSWTGTSGNPGFVNPYAGFAHCRQKWTVTFAATGTVTFGIKSGGNTCTAHAGCGYQARRVGN